MRILCIAILSLLACEKESQNITPAGKAVAAAAESDAEPLPLDLENWSHAFHVAELGIPCGQCHDAYNSEEMVSQKTCQLCHSQKDAEPTESILRDTFQ